MKNILTWTRMCANTGAPVQKVNIIETICRILLARSGTMTEKAVQDMHMRDCLEAAEVHLGLSQKQLDWRYRQWFAWQSSQPGDARVSRIRRNRNNVKHCEVKAFTKKDCQNTYREFASTVVELGLAEYDIETATAHGCGLRWLRPEALVFTDEKGSTDDKLGLNNLLGTSNTQVIHNRQMNHISVLNSHDATGTPLKPYIVVQAGSWNENLRTLWPDCAGMENSERGSFSSASFLRAMMSVLKGRTDKTKPTVVVMDTGGGKIGLHLSLELALWCEEHNVHPFILPPYSGKHLMTLDQEPHRMMESAWCDLRVQYMRHYGRPVCSIWNALPLIEQSWKAGMQKSVLQVSLKMCGILPWSPTKVLGNHEKWLAPMDVSPVQWSSLPDAIYRKPLLPTEKTPCVKCHASVTTSTKFCPQCGTANDRFSTKAAMAFGVGRRPGWGVPNDHVHKLDINKMTTEAIQKLRCLTPDGSRLAKALTDDQPEKKPDAKSTSAGPKEEVPKVQEKPKADAKTWKPTKEWRCFDCGNINAKVVTVCVICGYDAMTIVGCAKPRCNNKQPAITGSCMKCSTPLRRSV